jgi:hypothetical protein
MTLERERLAVTFTAGELPSVTATTTHYHNSTDTADITTADITTVVTNVVTAAAAAVTAGITTDVTVTAARDTAAETASSS